MNSHKLESKTSGKDNILWALLVVCFLLTWLANDHFSQQPLSIRLILWIIAGFVFGGVFFCTRLGKRFWSFVQSAHAELRKVVWPDRSETLRTTLLVLVVVVLAGLFLWAVDTFLLWLVTFLTG